MQAAGACRCGGSSSRAAPARQARPGAALRQAAPQRAARCRVAAPESAPAPVLPRPADVAAAGDTVRDRAAGCLAGGAAGAFLGHSVEPERHFRITRLFPEGLTDPWRFRAAPPTFGSAPAPPPRAPGDFAAAAAAAASLAASTSGSSGGGGGGAQPRFGAMLNALAGSYRPDLFQYTPYTELVLDALAAGTDPYTLARQADDFLNLGTARTARTSSGRAERQPYGAGDAGAALRAAPLGVAAAQLSDVALTDAVDEWVLFSHPQDAGRDGALAAAAAAAWLAAQPAGGGSSPEQLLDHVEQLVRSPDLSAKLQVVRGALAQVGQLPCIPDTASKAAALVPAPPGAGPVGSWREFWQSEAWGRIVEAHNRLALHGFATLGTQAAAVALLAICVNWREPRQAVILAASLGGNSSTTAALAGALAGAQHGCGWVPGRWWDAMGETEAGRALRDEAMAAGVALPQL